MCVCDICECSMSGGTLGELIFGGHIVEMEGSVHACRKGELSQRPLCSEPFHHGPCDQLSLCVWKLKVCARLAQSAAPFMANQLVRCNQRA